MSDKKDGGPAFPVNRELQDDGMTLRDYFAAKAMQGFLANDSYIMALLKRNLHPASICRSCFELADEMIKERDL